ncbi:MAG: hypothetical protein GQ569_09785 [Methylococcaceae bacterium]|nr:hypothetical protein [Methylococcaceae bacterium]
MINWHRLFGIFLTDYFTDTPYSVELEKDLSLQQQFLDVVILHKEQGEFEGVLPDGLENLNQHNLLSYKSMRESFDVWAINELIGHYVNYRKQLGGEPLVAESEFNLYAVSTRFPQGLKNKLGFTELKQGVYELDLSVKIRLIVLSRIEKSEHNAVWHLFSNVLNKIDYGKKYYHVKSNPSSAVNLLYEYYQLEGLEMPYTMEEFQKEVAQNHLRFLTATDVLKEIPKEDFLKQIPKEDILKRIVEKDFLKQLSKEEITRYLQQLNEVNDTKQ